MHNNLITDPIFTLRMEGRKQEFSLPQVLEALGKGRDIEFANLRRHQHHAWFAFLVQLGAIVCHRIERDCSELSAGMWAESLLELAGGEEAWCLVVDDLAKPAFMQPPVPEGTLSVLKNEISTPDGLDVLIVTRNHDLKQATIRKPKAEHWVFSLACLQTIQGFLGAGNFGVSRMNGGFSSRPSIGTAPLDDWGTRFLQEVPALLEHRKHLCGDDWSFEGSNGISLIWTLPWDGKTSLSFSQLDPLYIEICRRIRLHGVQPQAYAGVSKTARLAAKERFGDTGDFWTPLDKKERKSLTVPATGFSYKLLCEIVFGPDWITAPAQTPGKEASNLLIARVLVRGQGKTGGYHERVIPIPGKVRRFFTSPEGEALLATRSREMVELAGVARLKVLKPAVLVLGQGAPEKLNFKDSSYDARLADFDRRIDDVFFSQLFSNLRDSDEIARTSWHEFVWSQVEELFSEIAESIPSPIARGYKARAAADRTLYGSARKHISHAFLKKEATHAAESI